MGELKQGSDTNMEATVCIKEETYKAESETADLWQPKWNENQTVLAADTHTQTGTQVPGKAQQLEVGV